MYWLGWSTGFNKLVVNIPGCAGGVRTGVIVAVGSCVLVGAGKVADGVGEGKEYVAVSKAF